MERILDYISDKMGLAFEKAGYEASYGKVTVSNRPDLCEYQCNGALAAAKAYHCAPIQIAQKVVEELDAQDFSLAEAVMPGFINLRLSGSFLAGYLEQMRTAPDFGVEKSGTGKTVVVDYGGANVAKPLHIGHLRPAIIGESLKRLHQFMGYNAIGDVHLGDWGLQMGLIIAELQDRQPNLPYFDPDFTGEYPAEAPFTLTELEEIYPAASARKKTDAEFAERAHAATYALQQGNRGYRAIWQHIMRISLADLHRVYDSLDVHFEKWLGESDADPYIPAMVADLKAKGLAIPSEGAWVIPVAEPGDKKEIPPVILVKSDGSSIYATTDLATMVQRMQDWNPDKILYVTDKRQNLHFEQIFRAARKAGIVKPETELEHVGHGTMNGADGKPFKTRDGGVLRLEQLVKEMTDFVRAKVVENKIVDENEVENTTHIIALAALKYGDLSNQPTKDYNFDLERFAAFEGNTGPYILYTIVRVKSILAKYGAWEHLPIQAPVNDSAKDLMLSVTRLAPTLESALRTASPNLICAYIYELAGCVNKFYHETRILGEEDKEKQAGYIALIGLAKDILETCISILGFEAPEKM
ncbi:MAG: arginine--tRNA ligase [Candidatus Faecousia sp.]|nr:arginine--tRNA ligase [Clostridiales bacterium]MDD7340615.1 arginine--tRNA ligase [Bacillota bacterium]MDY2810086.1 arginine--tRNA ligase [Candidatus Faecousia sp.]